MKTYLFVGGLVAAGFDARGECLLTITDSGRGVFSTRTWERVARNYDLAHPEQGKGIGIGPIDGQAIAVTEMDFKTERMQLQSADGKITLNCKSDGIAVEF